ncbi:MAG: hypothetical protein LQ338_008345, partial [Usnochroma carphineum]
MGSRDLDTDNTKDEVTVLVTGFGPFGNNYTNPSHLVASTLPTSFTGENLPNIKIITASPIPVEYRAVRNVVPQLAFPQTRPQIAAAEVSPTPETSQTANPDDLLPLVDPNGEATPRFDFILHIGMAAPRKFYTMETCAHRDGYTAKDEAGESWENDMLWREGYKAPEILRPGLDVEDVWRRWKSELM